MPLSQILERYRKHLSYPWLALSFGAIYLVSQVTIGVILQPLGPQELGWLQVSGFTAGDYLETFARWESTGAMAYYKAHFEIDGIHWLWYTISLTAWLALSMEAGRVDSRYNGVLLFPLLAGLCDCLENAIQHVFLSDPQFSTIVNPLPLISTLASLTKWAAVTLAMVLAIVFLLRARRRQD